MGVHKVVISSADDRYQISKNSKIIIGKEYTSVLNSKAKNVLKTKDVIFYKIKQDDDEKEVKVVFAIKAKHSIITKAVFYLKNRFTGKIVSKIDKCEFDDGKWEMPDTDFSNKYTLVNIKVWYVKY